MDIDLRKVFICLLAMLFTTVSPVLNKDYKLTGRTTVIEKDTTILVVDESLLKLPVQETYKLTGNNLKLTHLYIANIITESGYCTSKLCTKYKNYFGMKYSYKMEKDKAFRTKYGIRGKVTLMTNEYIEGKLVRIPQDFAVFNSYADCLHYRHYLTSKIKNLNNFGTYPNYSSHLNVKIDMVKKLITERKEKIYRLSHSTRP